MREILFRGKTIDNEKWVYGYLIKTGQDEVETSNGKYLRTVEGYQIYDRNYRYSFVIPESIGQFTGSTADIYDDSKIFEGDILEVEFKGKKTICTVNFASTVGHFQLWQESTLPGSPSNLDLGNYYTKIIGNVFDNPDLLKSKDDFEIERE